MTTTNTATASSSVKISNTNTDVLCYNGGFFQKFIYRYNIWTGLYMLDRDERLWFHIFGWIFLSSFFTYVGVFAKGFFDGVMTAVGKV